MEVGAHQVVAFKGEMRLNQGQIKMGRVARLSEEKNHRDSQGK